MPKYQGGSFAPSYLPHWEYLGGNSYTMDGSSQAVVIPGGSQIFEIMAESGSLYFAINHPGFAIPTAPGFVPQNGGVVVGPLVNLNTLDVSGTAPAIAHIMFFREQVVGSP
ncbi:hypothetical protein LCGC14_1803200 [marine sediment metagenome]|uniref:Uncharacterized protein n=1 Tax=marine sediment metagenome TaxID=412755 RepID=A0A0F9J3N9_9ZZZZ